MSYADIWRADQGTDLDESHFAPWLVCPAEQLCDVSKRLHIRNSMGEKALGQYCCQKLFIDKPGLPFVLLTQSTDTPGRKQNGTINVLNIRHVST